jgi:hypothetical protein
VATLSEAQKSFLEETEIFWHRSSWKTAVEGLESRDSAVAGPVLSLPAGQEGGHPGHWVGEEACGCWAAEIEEKTEG